MRARHRHFNPRVAGADLVLDARYINQSNNTAISTWSDRSGNGYDASQATGTNQPNFLTAQQGGNGGVDFDGSNDFMTGTYNPAAVPRTFHAVLRGDGGVYADANYSGIFFQVPVNTTGNAWIARWGTFSGTTYVSGDARSANITLTSATTNPLNALVGSWISDSSRNVSFFRDGASLSVNGNPPTAVGAATTSGFRLGNYKTNDAGGEEFNGRLFSVHVWSDEQITAPLRKRCEHASAFSFKIACS